MKKGFTLIELLIAIAIIGILASVVFVSLQGARDKANVASVQATLKSTIPAAQTCMNDDLILQPYVAGDEMCTGSNSDWPDFSEAGGSSFTLNDNGGTTSGEFSYSINDVDNNTFTATQLGVSSSGGGGPVTATAVDDYTFQNDNFTNVVVNLSTNDTACSAGATTYTTTSSTNIIENLDTNTGIVTITHTGARPVNYTYAIYCDGISTDTGILDVDMPG